MKRFIICSAFLFSTLIANAEEHQSYLVLSPDESRSIVEVPQEIKDLGEERKNQIKNRGYISEYSEFAVTLSAFKDKKGTKESMIESDPYFKILRLNTLDFSLSFPFNGFPSVSEKNLLGFVPGGTYLGETKEWTGVTAFFTTDSLVCRLTIFDMPAMNGQSIYDSKHTTFNINKKPTWTSASGSPESGFLYEASWTGKRYEKMLECANQKPFNPRGIKEVVTLAKKIDKDLPDEP